MGDPGFTLAPARYAGRWNGKPQVAVRCESDGGGTKTRAMRICSALNMRWSNREKAYIASPTKAARLQELFAAGVDPGLGDCGGGKLGFVLRK